jgi:hypothetical protein
MRLKETCSRMNTGDAFHIQKVLKQQQHRVFIAFLLPFPKNIAES